MGFIYPKTREKDAGGAGEVSKSAKHLARRRHRAKQKPKEYREQRNALRKSPTTKTEGSSIVPGFRSKTIKKAEKPATRDKRQAPGLLTRIGKLFRREDKSKKVKQLKEASSDKRRDKVLP